MGLFQSRQKQAGRERHAVPILRSSRSRFYSQIFRRIQRGGSFVEGLVDATHIETAGVPASYLTAVRMPTLIGPSPERAVIIGYDNHHGKGHHRHAQGEEAPVT